jgi:hypothetical protein
VLKAQYTKGEWGRLRRFPMKRVLKGNGEHTKIQQKRKFPMKRVLKEQNGTNQALTFRGVPHERGVESCLDNHHPGSMRSAPIKGC